MLGAAVIYRTWGSRFAVIPANAGIHSLNGASLAGCEVDSRFRGNDRRIEWLPIPNDTTTACPACRRNLTFTPAKAKLLKS